MTGPDPELAGAGQATTFDPFARRYLEQHVAISYPWTGFNYPNPPPEKTKWWKGGDFLELMFPAKGWRLEDGRILLFNGRSDPIWLRLPSGVVKRPPSSILDQMPAAEHEFHKPEMTEAQKRRVSSDILKKWGLPVPTLQDFIATMRPIARKKHLQQAAEERRYKAEKEQYDRDRAEFMRKRQEEYERTGKKSPLY